jgi:hypothetical protein
MSTSFQAQGALVALNDARTSQSAVAVIRTSAAVIDNAALAAFYPLITSPPLGCRTCPVM